MVKLGLVGYRLSVMLLTNIMTNVLSTRCQHNSGLDVMYSKLILWKVSDYCKYFLNFIVLNLFSTFKLEKSRSLLFISLSTNLHQLIHCIVDINCSIKMCNLLNREVMVSQVLAYSCCVGCPHFKQLKVYSFLMLFFHKSNYSYVNINKDGLDIKVTEYFAFFGGYFSSLFYQVYN